MSEFPKGIPLDREVYAIFYDTRGDVGWGDDYKHPGLIMPEACESEKEARTHWRFNRRSHLSKEEIERTRVIKMTMEQFVKACVWGDGMNPIHTICKMDYCREIGMPWRREAERPEKLEFLSEKLEFV